MCRTNRKRQFTICCLTGMLIFAISFLLSACGSAASNDEAETTAMIDEEKSLETTAEETEAEETIPVFITNASLNVREGAGTSYSVIYTANSGDDLELTGNQQTTDSGSVWYEITTPEGDIGWVSGKYGTIGTGKKPETVVFRFDKVDSIRTYQGRTSGYAILRWKITPGTAKRTDFEVNISNDDILEIEEESLMITDGKQYYECKVRAKSSGEATIKLVEIKKKSESEEVLFEISEK